MTSHYVKAKLSNLILEVLDNPAPCYLFNPIFFSYGPVPLMPIKKKALFLLTCQALSHFQNLP